MRKHFASSDIELVIDLLSEGDPRRKQSLEHIARTQGIQELLDDAGLPDKLQGAPGV